MPTPRVGNSTAVEALLVHHLQACVRSRYSAWIGSSSPNAPWMSSTRGSRPGSSGQGTGPGDRVESGFGMKRLTLPPTSEPLLAVDLRPLHRTRL